MAHPPLDLLAEQLVASHGHGAALDACLALLAGAERASYVEELRGLTGLGFEPGSPELDAPRWPAHWVRSWGARGLLRIWADRAVPGVVAGLGDPHWRPAETCLKVVSLREVGEGGPGAALLAEHELPRVRAQAVRALGIVGDTEHVGVVEAAHGDPADVVRRAAALASDRLRARLDLG